MWDRLNQAPLDLERRWSQSSFSVGSWFVGWSVGCVVWLESYVSGRFVGGFTFYLSYYMGFFVAYVFIERLVEVVVVDCFHWSLHWQVACSYNRLRSFIDDSVAQNISIHLINTCWLRSFCGETQERLSHAPRGNVLSNVSEIDGLSLEWQPQRIVRAWIAFGQRDVDQGPPLRDPRPTSRIYRRARCDPQSGPTCGAFSSGSTARRSYLIHHPMYPTYLIELEFGFWTILGVIPQCFNFVRFSPLLVSWSPSMVSHSVDAILTRELSQLGKQVSITSTTSSCSVFSYSSSIYAKEPDLALGSRKKYAVRRKSLNWSRLFRSKNRSVRSNPVIPACSKTSSFNTDGQRWTFAVRFTSTIRNEALLRSFVDTRHLRMSVGFSKMRSMSTSPADRLRWGTLSIEYLSGPQERFRSWILQASATWVASLIALKLALPLRDRLAESLE